MEPVSVFPGVSIGHLSLGASLYEILTLIKADAELYPKIDLHHSQTEPLATPIVVTLPSNGLRLRFDGSDQRLRLIEVTDFRKIKLRHKGSDLIKIREDEPSPSGPVFRRVYELFGPSYPGEYFPPKDRLMTGTYVSSWPGVAFNFPLQHSAWSKDKDHVALLGSHAASPATTMALFEGRSWPEARKDLFVRQPLGPRMSALATRPKDNLPAEIELAHVLCDGRIDLIRQGPTGTFTIILNKTTVQDLNTELGAPDTTHKSEERDAIPEVSHRRTGSTSRPLSNGRSHPVSQPSSFSSTGTDTFETDFEPNDVEEDAYDRAHRQKFWCYFSHGLDILVGPPTETTPIPADPTTRTPLSTSPHLVVLKVVIHGNIPGSYAFNRHRRLRWTITLPPIPQNPTPTHLFSEQHFENDLKHLLLTAFASTSSIPASEMGRGKVVNRTWGGGCSSESSFFLPDAGEDLDEIGVVGTGAGSEQWLGNTRLFAFPGLAFEVLENGAVAGLGIG